MDSSQSSTVERLSVEQLPERTRRPKLVTDTTPKEPSTNAVVVQRVGIPEAMLSVLGAVAFVLSARLLLLLALLGAFVLGLLAMTSQTYVSVGILVAWALLVIFPLVWLEGRTKREA